MHVRCCVPILKVVPLDAVLTKLRVMKPLVIRCGTPDCDWGHKMHEMGEDQLRLCHNDVSRARRMMDSLSASALARFGKVGREATNQRVESSSPSGRTTFAQGSLFSTTS